VGKAYAFPTSPWIMIYRIYGITMKIMGAAPPDMVIKVIMSIV
jgi:hypothetical protein